MTYDTQWLPATEMRLTRSANHNSVTFPRSCCSGATCSHLLQVFAPIRSFVNITMTTYTFTGQPNYHCVYGGVAIHDLNNFIETFLVCNKHSHYTDTLLSFQPRSFYSSNSSLLIVMYQYKEYSSLSAKAFFSVTSCQGVQLNLCALQDLWP